MYQLILKRRATKETESYPAHELRKILAELELLKVNPRLPGCLKLTGQEGYRVRVGEENIRPRP